MKNIENAVSRNTASIVMMLAASFLAVAFMMPFQADAALLTQQLDQGMANSDVTSLQTFLSTYNNVYPSGLITGYFGPLTAAGVSGFQTANSIAAVGRVGPITLAAINAQMGGGSVPPSGDISAPIMYPETVSSGSNSATISWSTSEAARSRVMYSTTLPFLYSTALSVSTNGYGSTANITIFGLQPHTTYYYVRESIDGSGNITWTIGRPVTTQ